MCYTNTGITTGGMDAKWYNLAVSKPLVTVTATVTVRSANFRSASISLKSASIPEDQLQY